MESLMARALIIAIIAAACSSHSAVSQVNPRTQADGIKGAPVVANRYLRPDDFKNVPAQVRSRLNQQHCLIPQDVETAAPHNLVAGEFAQRGQGDWAAYCSVQGKSKVLVIWGGPAHCPGEPFGLNDPVDDDSLRHNADPEQWGRTPPHGSFWKLSVIRRAQVLARQQTGIVEGDLFKSASHDTLQRTSIAGANGVYCQNGKWLGLWYAD
jgi:hypothetical protein